MRRLPAVLVLISAIVGLAACSGGDEPAADGPTTARSTAPVVTPAPPNRACYVLNVADALELSNGASAVPCAQRHTSVTVFVGRLKPAPAGRPLVIDAPRVQRQIARTCRIKVDAHVGGTKETQRLSRVQAAWFSPTTAQAGTGARWFRCDLVIGGSRTTFTPLPARTRGLLAKAGALNRYGTCGTASPAAPSFRRVICAAPHTWRVRASIVLPQKTRYLAKAAGRRADSACRDIEVRRTSALTTLRWSFEWPTRAQWQNGQRYGLCWTPS